MADSSSSRRTFLGAAAALGGAAAGATRAEAQRRNPTTELLKIGVVGLGDNSHMNYNIWAPMINRGEPTNWYYGRTTRMLITHCWDSRPEVARAFARKYRCESVRNYDDMVGKVDGMIFAGFNEVPWWPELTRPYLEEGIPSFINRPFAYSMKDARAIVDTARAHNTPILCTDERESIQQAIVARHKIEQFRSMGRRILGAHSTNASGEWPQHGVHGLYFLLAVFGVGVESAAYRADGWWRKDEKSDAPPQSYGELTLQYDGLDVDGAEPQGEPFLVSQYQCWPRADITLRVYHDLGWWDIAHEYTPGEEGMHRHFYLFFPTVLAMQRMFETGEMPWSYDYILRKTKIYLAAFKSHLEHDGALVRIDDVPEDWTAPSPYPGWIDESIFR